MSKYQAHIALAAASQNHLQKMKHQKNFGFSPPSQIVANYANFGKYWHASLPNGNRPIHVVHDNRDFQNHYKKHPEQFQHSQVLPNVHPSIITPFLEQVQIKQKEAAAAEQHKKTIKQSHETNSHENDGSFEIINDVFSKHLVPPPQNPLSTVAKPEKEEKLNKYNLAMQSPLQDASRFNYNNVISTATPASNDYTRFRPSAPDNTYYSTEKPNVFVHLNNRTKENVYKSHKLLHPSYTGGLKKKPVTVIEKPFLPTPFIPESEELLKIDYEPQHSFFTIEDAVTPNLGYHKLNNPTSVKENPESITLAPKFVFNYEKDHQSSPTEESSTQRPRQKLRRRKPKPQQQLQSQFKKGSEGENLDDKSPSESTHLRGNIKASGNNDTASDQNNLRTRNRANHPIRTRNRLNLLSSPATILTTLDTDHFTKFSTEDNKSKETSNEHEATTEMTTTAKKAEESVDQPGNVKRRVRLRLKNKLRPVGNTLEAADFKMKVNDNHIADTEHEKVIVKQFDDTTESLATERNPHEVKSTLRLPNLKLRSEHLTTLPTTADTISTAANPTSFTKSVEEEEGNALNKIINRPRFSIKDYKRKQFSTSLAPATTSTSTTAVTTTRPDSQRFNRLRFNLTRRNNETNDNSEESKVSSKKRTSTTRTTTVAPETVTQTSTTFKRGSSKRTFPARNFTRPTTNPEYDTTTVKPIVRITTAIRPVTPNLRSRIQSYKRKESAVDEAVESSPEPIKNTDLSSEVPLVSEQTTFPTEPPLKHETSIMKIAKIQSTISHNNEKSTTTNNLFDDVTNASRDDTDLTGSPSEHSQRVAELTISGNEDYTFKSANIGPLSRRIPNYFTISTDDPILPIQAFFPQIKTNDNI